MGMSNSKKPRQVQQIEPVVINNNNNNNNNTNIIDNNSVDNGTADFFSRFDRQIIQTLKKDFRDTPELFVLNNMVMCVMFFEDYKKYTEQLLEKKLEKADDYVAPDIIFEKVSQNVLCRPHHGPKKCESEPLLPKRLFILNEGVKVVGTTEDTEENNVEDNEKTTVRIEESGRKGYVRLRELNTRLKDGGSPILRLNSVEPNSRSSTDSSDTAYTTLINLKTPKPIDIIKGLERQSSQSSGLPRTCISYRKIKKISWDPDELRGEEISDDDLYETVSYINSKSFMKHLKNDVFLKDVGSKFGLNLGNISQSQIIQEKIFCSITEGEKSIPCEITPSIRANWPLEQTLKFVMKGDRSPQLRKRFVFPTSNMIQEIVSLGCVLLPKGYLDKKDADLEWELSFPQAQKYLETFMNHAQMKSLLILLALHKTYIEPKTKHLGLTTEHIKNFLLLECESNFSDWPEHRLGIKLISVIKSLNNHLSKARPHIPDFFVTDKNSLSEVPTRKIRQAQKVFDEIIQAPVMYFMKALRNLRYTNGRTFFPPFDFKTLHDLLNKSGLEFSNPQLAARKINKQKYSEPEILVSQFKDAKKRQAILKKRQEEQEKENNGTREEERRESVDSIDVNWECEKKFDIHKKRALLKFFIDTFIDIAEQGLKISSKKNTLLYVKQAYYLTNILLQESSAFGDEANELLEKISELETKCEQIEESKSQCDTRANQKVDFGKGANKQVEFSKNTHKLQVPNSRSDKKVPKNGQNGVIPRKSVTFVEVHQQLT